MSCKKGGKTKKHLLFAKLAKKSAPCVFCQRDIDDEVIYGKLYAIGDIHCHYFCVLLSCCLVQRGKDNEGLFGFLYPDIIAEVERSKKHKCSYCGREGATLGCGVNRCRKQFHLPCSRERNAVTLYFGSYKTFCEKHAPVQKINEEIMEKVRPRLLAQKKQQCVKNKGSQLVMVDNKDSIDDVKEKNVEGEQSQGTESTESICVICYEIVDGYPTLSTFWPPCCARDAWFHRSCLQRMALSAGMHYLKCPLCNEKEVFYKAVLSQGYYVPDRDAAWELEQNAFAEIYERVVECGAPRCVCPGGRGRDDESGSWVVKICLLCGSTGIHEECMAAGVSGSAGSGALGTAGSNGRYVCATCLPVAPDDIESLADNIETVVLREEVEPPPVHRPVMPCRMSLRRTKQRIGNNTASSSNSVKMNQVGDDQDISEDISRSRLELNLKSPKKPSCPIIELNALKNVENKLLSPIKLLEQGLYENMSEADMVKFELDLKKLLEDMRERFKKPKPLTEKMKIVKDTLHNILENVYKGKTKELLKEWNSPKKCLETAVKAVEVNENDESVIKETSDETENATQSVVNDLDAHNMDSEETSASNETCAIKFSSISNEVLQCNKLDIDVESFKHQYLNEVDRDFKLNNTNAFGTDDLNVDKEVGEVVAIEKGATKRKQEADDTGSKRRRKMKRLYLKYKNDTAIKVECKRGESVKMNAKRATKDVRVKIKWRKEQLKVKITGTSSTKQTLKLKGRLQKLKRKRGRPAKMQRKELRMVKERGRTFKNGKRMTKLLRVEIMRARKSLRQYVLNYSPESVNSSVIERPEHEVTPKKRRYTKSEKVADGLVQTSIHSFFKPKPDV